MKRPVAYSYAFAPASGTLTFAIPNFKIANLFAVIDLATGAIVYAPVPGLGYATLSGSTLTLQAPMAGLSAADPLMVLYDDGDLAAVAGDGTVATGGTAQPLFGGAVPASGWKVANPDPAEDLWVSDSATAAPNGQGSVRVFANGGQYATEPGEKPAGPISLWAATAGHRFTARRW